MEDKVYVANIAFCAYKSMFCECEIFCVQGAVFLYDKVLQPFVARYENDIDVNLHEIQTRGTDLVLEYSKGFLAKIIEAAQKGAQAAPRAYQVRRRRQKTITLVNYCCFALKLPTGCAYHVSV